MEKYLLGRWCKLYESDWPIYPRAHSLNLFFNDTLVLEHTPKDRDEQKIKHLNTSHITKKNVIKIVAMSIVKTQMVKFVFFFFKEFIEKQSSSTKLLAAKLKVS